MERKQINKNYEPKVMDGVSFGYEIIKDFYLEVEYLRDYMMYRVKAPFGVASINEDKGIAIYRFFSDIDNWFRFCPYLRNDILKFVKFKEYKFKTIWTP